MGGNFLRISHYPQDPVVLEMCDRLGILASVEIPVVNAVTESDAFLDNSVRMAREMIRQDFNHPSVIIWAYIRTRCCCVRPTGTLRSSPSITRPSSASPGRWRRLCAPRTPRATP